jgi:hypothetical protein
MIVSRPSLKIEVIWLDDHMLELCLSISSADFAGRASFYAAFDEPARFAKHIEGFPSNTDDIREYEFGGAGMRDYCGAKVRLSCTDGSGHLVLQVTVHKNPDGLKAVAESATVQLHSVPAAVDVFVEDLRRMKAQVGEVAVLQNAI